MGAIGLRGASRRMHEISLFVTFFFFLSFFRFFTTPTGFRCHGNRGRFEVNFYDTGKLPILENPLFGATCVAQFLVLGEF